MISTIIIVWYFITESKHSVYSDVCRRTHLVMAALCHYPRWQHHFTVPRIILDDLWSHFLGCADGVYFQYGNALSAVSFLCYWFKWSFTKLLILCDLKILSLDFTISVPFCLILYDLYSYSRRGKLHWFKCHSLFPTVW